MSTIPATLPLYILTVLSASQKQQTRWKSPKWETFAESDLPPSPALRAHAQQVIDKDTAVQSAMVAKILKLLQDGVQQAAKDAAAYLREIYDDDTERTIDLRLADEETLRRRGMSSSLGMEFYRVTYLGDLGDFEDVDAYTLHATGAIHKRARERQEDTEKWFRYRLGKIEVPKVEEKYSPYAQELAKARATQAQFAKKILNEKFGVSDITLLDRSEYVDVAGDDGEDEEEEEGQTLLELMSC